MSPRPNQGTFPPPSFITISSGTSSSSSSPSASPSPCTKEPLQKHRLPQQIRDTAILDSESSAEELYPAQEPAQTPTVQGMITDSSESESDSSYLGDPGIAELVTGKFRRIHSKPSKTTKSARPDGKYSLANMVKQEKSKKDAQDRVLQYQKQMDSMEQAETSMSDVQGEQYLRSGKLDKSLLASMVDGNEDEENVDKVAQALDRAEVLRMEISWGFFENHKPACAPPPFPSSFTGSQSSQFNSLKGQHCCKSTYGNFIFLQTFRFWLPERCILDRICRGLGIDLWASTRAFILAVEFWYFAPFVSEKPD